MMNDEDRKQLTEWLGECWLTAPDYWKPYEPNRTFTEPDDMMACKDRLAEVGLIEHFDAFIYIKWHEWFEGDEGQYIYFWEWLIEPDRFCQLCADFLKEGE